MTGRVDRWTGRQMDRLVDGVSGQVLSVRKRGASAEAGVAFLWMDRAVGQGFLPAVVVRPVRVARAMGVQEEEGQGRVTGTGPASRCYHTLGLP